jgi:anaerobic selenocysteine-containing dehydrogenase
MSSAPLQPIATGAVRDGVHLRTCPLCEAMCGLRVDVGKDGRVARIRPNEQDVWSRGYLCPKGTALAEVHDDPDRLRRPLVKRDGQFVEVGWPEAFAAAWQKLGPVIEGSGLSAVTAYIGNPTAHNFSLSRYVPAFIALSDLPIVYSAGTVDQWPKNLSCALLFGGMWTVPTPDIDRADYLVVLGANPADSQGSLLAVADVLGRLKALRERGGKVVVVDPRRTGTAERADEWLPIVPGTDAALLLAMAHVLFAENRVRLRHLEGRVTGVEAVRSAVESFTPEAVEASTGVAAATVRRLARELAAAERGAVYGRIGTCNQEFGALASWAVDVLNVLTGNLDREGGAMFGKPLAWSLTSLPDPQWAEGFRFGRFKSRVRGAPEVLGQFPVSCLAEEIATPGQGRIEALITIAGNPVISTPDAGRLDAALPELACMISLDNWLNETTRHADVILPGLSPLEQPHYDELIWSWAVRSAGKYSGRLYEPEAGRPEEWEILLTLAGMLQGRPPGEVDAHALDQLFFAGLVAGLTQLPGHRLEGRDPAEVVAASPGRGPERLLDLQLRTGPWGDAYGVDSDGLTLDVLRREPHGVDFGPMVPRLDELLRTPSGKVELAPEYLLGDLPRLRERLGREPSPGKLLLVSRRHVRSNNSWMHNVPSLVTGRERCTLQVHPEDAERLGLRDGGRARVSSEAGSVVAPVEVTDGIRPGTVCLPHGWGHDKQGARVSVARRHAGVNNNLLAPGRLTDPLSNNAVVNGIEVSVAAA